MNYDEKIIRKEKGEENGLKIVANVFEGLLEDKSGIKVTVKRSKMKICKKRGIFEAI